jgi:hypothetical protein
MGGKKNGINIDASNIFDKILFDFETYIAGTIATIKEKTDDNNA